MEVSVNFSNQSHKKQLYEYLKNLRGVHIVTITKTTRRLNWNNYYWAVIVRMGAEHMGLDSPREMHEIYKERYLAVFNTKLGKEIFEVGSTKKMPQDKFEQYCEFCRMFNSIEFGFYTPDIWEAREV